MSAQQTTTTATTAAPPAPADQARTAAFAILFALSFSHLINDTLQAILPAVYPILKDHFALTFTQIGMITFCFQVTGSIFQPVIGFYTDRHPQPYSLVAGMALSFCGIVGLACAGGYSTILASAALLGLGSAIFHPESSRMARLASGGRHGFAQSLFQVGGNAGSALGPLLAAWIIVPYGQRAILFFTSLALVGMIVLSKVGAWYATHLIARHRRPPRVDVLQILLPRRLHQLLHVLPHRKIRRQR